MRIRAVIFDLGGVVVHWKEDTVYRKAAKIIRTPFSKVKKYGDHELDALCLGKITENEFWRRLLKRLGVHDHVLHRLDRLWYREYSRGSRLNRGVMNLVTKLRRHYVIGVISNLSIKYDIVNRKKNRYKHLQHLVLSYKVGLLKPDPRIYRLAARKVRCRPQDCLFIDDKLVNVKGARRAWMNVVHYRNITQLKREMKRYGILV